MPRFNRNIRPVNSMKHVVDAATVAVPGAVVSSVPIVTAVDNPTLGSLESVNKGCRINAIFLKVEAIHNSGTFVTIPRVYMTIQKSPGNDVAIVYPANVGNSDSKKWVIHQEMMMMTGIAADDNSFPRTLFVGVVLIPPKMKRFGTNDRLVIHFALDAGETTATVSVCVQCIYKEFF